MAAVVAVALALLCGVAIAADPVPGVSGMTRSASQTDTANHGSAIGSSEESGESGTHTDASDQGGDRTKSKEVRYGQGNAGEPDPTKGAADHVWVWARGGSVESTSYISDEGGDGRCLDPATPGVRRDGSLVQGMGISHTKLTVSVEKDDSQVYLWFENEVVHQRDYKSLGKEYREIDNFGRAKTIDKKITKWKTKALYKTGTGWSHTVSVSRTGGSSVGVSANGPEIGGTSSTTNASSSTVTHGEDQPIIGGEDPTLVVPLGPFEGFEEVTKTVKWFSQVKQILIADGIKNQATAETSFSNFHVLQEVWADYGYVALPREPTDPVIWAGGQSQPSRFERVGSRYATSVRVAALPKGLSGDSHSRAGMLACNVTNPTASMWKVVLSVTPSGAVTMPSELDLPAGASLVTTPIVGEIAGAFTITAEVRDENNDLVESYDADGSCAALSSILDVALFARVISHRDLAPGSRTGRPG